MAYQAFELMNMAMVDERSSPCTVQATIKCALIPNFSQIVIFTRGERQTDSVSSEKNAEFLKTGGNNLQSQHLAASSSLYANIFKFSRHIPDVCYIFL